MIGMIAILIAVLSYGIHVLSYSAPLSIRNVVVTGANKIDPTIIESFVDAELESGSLRFFSKRNIFLYPREILEEGIIESFPRVKSASLSREGLLSRDLKVLIVEREPYALWCQLAQSEDLQADCFALDEGGHIFSAIATSTHGEFKTSYLFSGGVDGEPIGQQFLPGQLSSMLALLRMLQQETNLIPAHIELLKEQDFNVLFEQGFFVKASLGQDPEMLAGNLDLVLKSDALKERVGEIEYIDLRFGNRVYYKMKGEEQKNI